MKERLVSAGVGIALFIVVMFCMDTPVYDLAFCIVALLAVHELLSAYGIPKQDKTVTLLAMGMGVLPFLPLLQLVLKAGLAGRMETVSAFGCCLAILLMLFCFLCRHHRLSFPQIAVALFSAIAIPNGFAMMVSLRNRFGGVEALYLILFTLSCAWGADSGAFFAGKFFGKRKLAPTVSPKKTVEGLYGGLISGLLLAAVFTLVWEVFVAPGAGVVTPRWWLLFLCLPVTLAGVLGDLTASAIKRQCGIKDFGTIMPGHGGILDRFDSVLFAAPLLISVLSLF